jgi:hypothetical protein
MRSLVAIVLSAVLLACGSDAPHKVTVTVSLTGSASGGVAADGLSCSGATCTGTYDRGGTLVLTASPGSGAVFAGWSGDCSGRGSCTLVLDADRAVTADFAVPVTLTVAVIGEGSGTVSAPDLACAGATCTGTYARGQQVTVRAVPTAADPASYFSGWSGACTGSGDCVVTLDGETSLNASFGLRRQTLTVTVRHDGGGEGHVTSDPPGIDCDAGTCSGAFVLGRSVTLAAAPGASRFVRWRGACAGSGSCQIAVAGDAQVEAVFLGANYVFATSTDFSPSNTSLDRADAECNARAASAGLPGRYVAWMSTSAVNARDRVGTARGWVRIDGYPFADQLADPTSRPQGIYPALYDEAGRALTRPDVLTGTRPDGTLEAGFNCGDWSSREGNVLAGRVTSGGSAWTAAWGTACSTTLRLHVLCLGVDVTAPLAPTPESGRKAFLSRGSFPGYGGVPELDILCGEEAAAAGLAGRFKALVATSAASAVSRFDLTGARWVRTDGLPLVATASDLAAGTVVAPLNVHADGAYVGGRARVVTGAANPGVAGTLTTTCSDWTAGAGARGLSGDADATSPSHFEYPESWFFGDESAECSWFQNIYCLQE